MSMAEYERLYAMATTMSDARDQVAVFEELLRLSDSNGDVEVSFKVRMEMVSLCNEGGYPEKAIVAFTWCLAEFDKNPELGSLYNLIWTYKVILEYIPIFSTISKDQIVSIQEDMAKRLLTYGETERTAHYYRSWNWMRMGDYETALEYQQRYVSMKRSTVSDCNACELDRRIELFSRMARDEECLTMAEPVIAGRSRCGEVPEFTNAHIARCLLRQDKISKAIKLEASGYPLVARQRKYLGTIGDLMLVLVRAGDFDTLVSRIVRHLVLRTRFAGFVIDQCRAAEGTAAGNDRLFSRGWHLRSRRTCGLVHFRIPTNCRTV